MKDAYIIEFAPCRPPKCKPCGELTLEYMQNAVEGYIEVISLNNSIDERYSHLRMIVNEEGKMRYLLFNPIASVIYDMMHDLIFGNALIVAAESCDLRPLAKAEADEIIEYFGEIFNIAVEYEEDTDNEH